jgi:NAD(P)-dependent dehydrogenase (short-subunit alcohol dehydrogenase family)
MRLNTFRIGRLNPDYTGKVAVVTGAGSGIGRATAVELARLGAEVHLADVDDASVQEAAAQIQADGAVAHAHAVNVTDADAVQEMADRVYRASGRVDILHNNAGIAISGRTEELDLAAWRRVVEVNIMGVVHGIASFGPRMLRQDGGGHIINTASAAGLTPVPGLVPYAMSKHAVVGLTESLNAEWSPQGVYVSALCPGIVNTPIARSVAAGAQPDQSARVLRMYEKLGATPESVAAAVVTIIEKRILIRPVPRTQVVPEWWLRRLHPSAAQPTARLKQRFFGT